MIMRVQKRTAASGFTMLEVLIVLALLSIIMAAIFTQINTAQQRSAMEQQKLDMFQESREFMDQMTRDLRNTGYPSRLNLEPEVSSLSDRTARGLLYVSPGDIWFEGDVEGTGTVSLVKYHLDTSTTDNCPCLRRSQISKTTALSGGLDNYSVEVQYVQNGTLANPIFEYFDTSGNEVDLSGYSGNALDGTAAGVTSADLAKLASIQTVKIQLSVQSKAPDLMTKQRPIMTLNSMVTLGNCSYVHTGGTMSCGN